MVQPFDYSINAIDPVAALQSGMAFGQQQRANEQQMQLAQSQEQRAQTEFGQQSTLFDQGQADRAAAMEAQRAMNQDFAGLADKFAAGEVAYGDIAAMTAKYPDLSQQLGGMWEGLAIERKAADTAQLVKGVIALKSGRPDLTIKMLEDRAAAAENGGDQQEADTAKAMAEAIKASPEAGLASLSMLLQVVDPDAAKTVFGSAPEMTADQKNYDFYAKQETEAGRKPLSFNEWGQQNARAGASTTTINTGAVSADGTPKVGVSLAEIQTSVKSATDLIDEISNDPALPKVTGSLEGGGGNAVDEFGAGRAAYYGDDGLAVIQKIAQLQNTAWLAARDMLKGGGAITDYESKKAEGAMARLSRRQGDAEYKAALNDLRDAITEGARKLQAAGAMPSAAAGSNSQPPAADLPAFDDAFSKYGVAP